MMSIRLTVPVVMVILISLILREANGKSLKGVNIFGIAEDDQMSTGSPAFCHKLDCPAFSVVNTTEAYEERLYNKSGWVSTKLEGDDYTGSQPKMFKKLLHYIQGENAKGAKIPMTTPVITHVAPGPGPTCGDSFMMSFFIAPKVIYPPQPTDKTVFLSSLLQQTVYVKSFGKHADDSLFLKSAEELASALSKDGKKFNKDFFYTVVYDSPMTFFNRHNEVWIMAE